MDSNDIDQITKLLGDSASSGATSGVGSIFASLMPLIIASTVVTILLVVLYAISVIQRWRVNHAILEIRDMVRDIKAATEGKVQAPTPEPAPKAKPAEEPKPKPAETKES